ncbi:hypothetical protein HAX54_005864, partial [Datura stramonium]|nr:hypothetical protein [Datura stramonium]
APRHATWPGAGRVSRPWPGAVAGAPCHPCLGLVILPRRDETGRDGQDGTGRTEAGWGEGGSMNTGLRRTIVPSHPTILADWGWDEIDGINETKNNF